MPSAMQTDPREELIIRYTVGQGVVHSRPAENPTEVRITVTGKIYTLDGKEDGTWEGVDAPVSLPALQEAQDLTRPANPEEPFDKPEPPVKQVNILTHSKGVWKFADGSSITAIGPANVRIVLFPNNATELWVTGEQIITNGTGRYEGAQGLKTVGGSSWVRPGRPLFIPEPFSAKTVEVFRIVRREFITPA